jgi:hypothetical protein
MTVIYGNYCNLCWPIKAAYMHVFTHAATTVTYIFTAVSYGRKFFIRFVPGRSYKLYESEIVP